MSRAKKRRKHRMRKRRQREKEIVRRAVARAKQAIDELDEIYFCYLVCAVVDRAIECAVAEVTTSDENTYN